MAKSPDEEVKIREEPQATKKPSNIGNIIRAVIIIGVLGMMVAILLIGILRGPG